MGNMVKKINKRRQTRDKSGMIAYGTPVITISDTAYKTYKFTDEWTGNLPDIPQDGCIFIKDKYYDMFQYFLNYLRASKKIFYVLPIETYKKVFSEQVLKASEVDYDFSGCSHMLNNESWIIAIPQYITSKKHLYILGHEVAHIYLDNLPENDQSNQKIDYKAEYEADTWAYAVMEYFGYLTPSQRLKLTELSQLEILVWTKQITPEAYDKIASLDLFKTYDRSKGLLSDVISAMILKGISGGDIIKMLPETIGGNKECQNQRVKQY
ncbi:hypothetical protein P22_1936 [Propionispora sp. 2/2-37]|uniref:hypothetical protein n=1 Tax=Propionispora sp. 2/2-37 TaxID=1677858 RepID=UPI0006BB90E6|nr:hypothetical protein [Propionispora sp. 2/2-37]CUH95851.1 hypothetical protein P22_1936 [Propionispora sp. 2/2-37]